MSLIFQKNGRKRFLSRSIEISLTLLLFSVVPVTTNFAQDVTPHPAQAVTPLADLLQEAEQNNPQIQTAWQSWQAAKQVPPQVSTLPDPEFQIQQFSVGSPRPFAGYTNSDFAYISLGASRQIPYPGKLKVSGEVAEQPREGQTRASSYVTTALDWESQARLHHGLEGSSGTLTLSQDGVVFRPAKGSTLHWPFLEIQTFDLLSARRLVITGYKNRSWHRHGERKFCFDLDTPMPPGVAAEFARQVGKPVRNGNPNPTTQTFATIPARHRTFWGGTNGTLRFGANGIEYVTTTGKGGRDWRWSDIDTLANPDPYHFTLTGYRETFEFELKEPMSSLLFDRLWDHVYARDFRGGVPAGGGQNP